MYEAVIRQVIEQCWKQYGGPPRKIAVTALFFNELRIEISPELKYVTNKPMVDLLFGNDTRVYVSPGSDHMMLGRKLTDQVIAWEVPLGIQP